FLCFSKGDWQQGLPMLARGSDAKLKELAKKDLGNPQDPERQIELADSWWEIAEKLPSGKRYSLNCRIYHVYSGAVAHVEGIARLRVEKRLKMLPPFDTTLVLWNTHNATANDRGTTELGVLLFDGLQTVWTKKGLHFDWKPDQDILMHVPLPAINFTKI